jgi:ABC-type transporter Mla MlaB component
MVRIDVRHDEALELTVFSVSGSVTAEDFVAAIEAHYGPKRTSNAIWDVTQSDLSNIDMSALILMSDSARKHSENHASPRTIIVVADEQEARLARLYGEISEMRGSPIHYVLATSLEEAYDKLDIADPFQNVAGGAG